MVGLQPRHKDTEYSDMNKKNIEKNAEISARLHEMLSDASVSPNFFAAKLGYSRAQTVYDILNGKCAPSYDFFKRFLLSEYSAIYNIDWLITGRGHISRGADEYLSRDFRESIKSHIADNEQSTLIGTSKPVQQGGIPLIPIEAVAGVLSGDDVSVMDYECEHYTIPMFKGAEFLIQVKGDSMQPKYYSGDIVACKRLPLDTFFQWNRVYVVDTEQGVLIKRVRAAADTKHITLVSENPDYAPFEISRKQIYSLALVLGVVRAE